MSGRRGNREGSVRQREDGRWEARVAVQIGPRLVRRSVYGTTRAECQRHLAEATRSLQRGVIGVDGRLTVADYLGQWLEKVAPSLRPNTLLRYRGLVAHITGEIGNVRLRRLSPHDVDAMLARKRDAGQGPRTLSHMRACLRTALNQAIRWELLERNVASLSMPPQLPERDVPPMSPHEALNILAAVAGTRLEGIVTVGLACGLRPGETLGLTWDCVDLEQRLLTVRNGLSGVDGTYRLIEPKTRRSRRSLPLPDVAAAALRRQRARQREDRLRAGTQWHEPIEGLVFTTELGAPRNASTVTHQFSLALRTAGLPHRTMHQLRHGCATLLLAQGVDLKTVSSILGHSQISLTANTYAGVLPGLHRAALDRLDVVLAGNRDDTEIAGPAGVRAENWGQKLGSNEQTEQSAPMLALAKFLESQGFSARTPARNRTWAQGLGTVGSPAVCRELEQWQRNRRSYRVPEGTITGAETMCF